MDSHQTSTLKLQRQRCVKEIDDFIRIGDARRLRPYELRLLSKLTRFLMELDEAIDAVADRPAGQTKAQEPALLLLTRTQR